jgi:hypothetical protein
MALWDGGESSVDNTFIGVDGNSVGLPMRLNMRATSSAAGGGAAPSSVRITYTGGLAYHGTQSVYAFTAGSGTFTVGNFVRGQTSQAWGIIIAVNSSAITIEVMFGMFIAGEALKEYSSEVTPGTGTGNTGTLGALTSAGLADVAPDLVRACEVQVRHYFKHKYDFETTGTQKDGGVSRRTESASAPILTEEAAALCVPYKMYPVMG